jgi:DNA repair protein RadC
VKIKDFPKEGRPRERFLNLGPGALSDAELLAIILRTGTKNENVIDVSNRLINEYGLDKLFSCSLEELTKIKGIGPAKAMQIMTIKELAKRNALAINNIKKITSAKDVFNLMKDKLKDQSQENFIALHLNSKLMVLKEEAISKGILDASIVHPREVFRNAIKSSSHSIIIIHNHPSGDPTPSQEDLDVTRTLIEAGDLLGIKVLDHVIIGSDKYWSWKESSQKP